MVVVVVGGCVGVCVGGGGGGTGLKRNSLSFSKK